MNIMKLLFFIVVLFCFVNLGVCLDNLYLNCSTQTFECGGLDNIGYPFSGMRRPYNCGLPDFLLNCTGNSPEMYSNGEKYGVLKIEQQNKIMRIVNPDFLLDGTCPWSHIRTTALDFRLFHYSEKVVNITLFTGCNISSMRRLLNHQDFTRFFCPGNSTDGNVDGYFIHTQSLIRIPRQNLPTCRYNITVPVMKTLLDGVSYSGLRDVLGAGFEISYADDAENNSTCKICNISGGECGYDSKRDKPVCFCPEGSPIYGTTQRCAEDSGDETKKYRNCSSEAFECEILNPVKYPFWGMRRPRYCGLPDLNLQCVDDTPLIFINSQKYHILNIDQENKMMRIVNTEFMVHGGCPWPNAKTTTLDFRLFNYSKRVVNVTLFTGCSNSSILLSNNQSTRYALCPGNLTNDYVVETQSLIENPHQNLPKCTNNVTVPVMKIFLERGPRDHIGSTISSGFEVSYDIGNAAEDISNCKICEKSGGECGYDTAFTCFCPNGRNTRTSARNGKTQTCAEDSGRGELERNIIIGTSVAVCSILASVIVVLLIYLRKKQIERKHDQQIVEAFYRNQGSLALKRYRYLDVKKMTNSFKEKIGQGGFGSVFKGKLHDGHPVAVKLLFTNSKNNGEEFINEVESISRTSHINVVNLLGFCLEGKKRALIYEYMPNGSLEKFIYNDMPPLPSRDHHPQLGGDTLYQIAIGIARGLEYLHRGCNTRILHFDIKPHNILLDEEFCPKIADFGLAKLCTRKESKISFLGTRGTTGYIAPEVFSRNFGGVSYKSDVYSYGMLILEMVGGRKNFNVGVGMDHSSEFYYPHWIYDRLEQSDILGLHGIILTKASEEIARKMIIVGLWCIQTNSTNRPSMTKVLEMLEGSIENLHIPPKPFLCSPSRTSPTTILLSTKRSSSTSQQPSPSTLISMSIGR